MSKRLQIIQLSLISFYLVVNLVKVGGKQLPGGWSPLGPADANAKRVIDLVSYCTLS